MDSKIDLSHRPIIPKKPDKDKISLMSPGGGGGSESRTNTNSFDSFSSPKSTPTAEARRSYFNGDQQKTPPIPPTKPLPPSSSSLISPNSKPALPPKPQTSSPRHSLSSPPTGTTPPVNTSPPTLLPKGRNSLSIANAILSSANLNAPQNVNSPHRSIRSPSAPTSPRPVSTDPKSNPPPRPSSVFNFPIRSPEKSPTGQNLNNNLPPKSLRGKSTSLGRNIAPPTSPTSVSQFFSSKAATLARMLPLDLNFGKSSPNPPHKSSIPTLIQNLNQSSHTHQQNISFSNNSPIPPPPPPRLRRKLSPIGSLSPVSDSSPNSPPPVFSSISPPPPISEERSSGGFVIYAQVDKDKKWAERRLKQDMELTKEEGHEDDATNPEYPEEGIQGSLVITINRDSHSKLVNVQSVSCSEVLNSSKDNAKETSRSSVSETSTQVESVVVDSWLGKFLTQPVTSHNSDKLDQPPNDNCIQLSPMPGTPTAPVDTTSNSIPVDELTNAESVTLVDNRSFLFSPLSTVGGQDPNPAHPPMTTSNSAEPIEDTSLNPDSLLLSVEGKIQSVVSRLSNLSGKSSPTDSASPQPPPIPEEFESLAIIESDPNQASSTNGESNLSPTTPSSLVRRRSWNCSQDSSSPCDSSSSSLTNLKTRTSKPTSGWVDEGDSTGVLGDVDTSDAAQPTNNSSLEDIGSTLSLRRRTMKLFSSFGKSGTSSSSSSNSTQKKRVVKDKKADANGCKPGKNMSRQISGPILSTPPTPLSPNPPPESTQLTREKSRSHPTVQFSPDVITTPTPPSSQTPSKHHRLSEGSIGSPMDQSSPPQRGSLQMPESEQDDESLSSFGSLSTISTGCNLNLSNCAGYEDILSELSPLDRKAFYVAREILTSEQTFIDVLDLLTIDFPNAVRRYEESLKHPIIPPQELEMIMAGLPTLKRVNEELQTDLQARISNWLEVRKLSDVIVKKGPFLKLYAHYIKNFEKTTAKLDECCGQYPPFKKALLEFEQSERCHKLGLKHFMLKPVQRMPQYRLLLSDYLKNLEVDSQDYEDTVKALAIVKDVADHANEAIKLQVNADKLLHLQNRLTGSIIMKSDRQLLKEGELVKVCRKDLQPRFFALMNDCLMCMSYNYNVGASGGGSSKDLKLRHELPLTGMRICLSPSEDYQNEFSVISTARSFNLVAKSPREREDWMKALNDAVNDNIRKRTCRTPDQEEGFALGKIAPVWIQDSRVTMCQICTAEFTVTFRRHHCRSCGKVVCRHCSGNEAPLQYRKNDAERVCDECYQYLLEEFDKESATDGLETCRETIRTRFKKVTPNISTHRRKRNGKSGILEIPANNSGSKISSYLHCRERKAWKRRWFVLMDRVLYIYAASEDIVAIKSFPVLGWNVDYEKEEFMDGGDSESVFKLTHLGQNTFLFQADNPTLAERWINLMKEATVLT